MVRLWRGVWSCYGPAWAVSGLAAQAWLGNTAYRSAKLAVSLALPSRHGAPGGVRWQQQSGMAFGAWRSDVGNQRRAGGVVAVRRRGCG